MMLVKVFTIGKMFSAHGTDISLLLGDLHLETTEPGV